MNIYARLSATAIALGLAAGSVAVAQEASTAPGADMHKPMMGKQSGSMMKGMDQAQMHRMMENCNRMMESRMQPPAVPAPEKKG